MKIPDDFLENTVLETNDCVNGFVRNNKYLSNFYLIPIMFCGIEFPSVENAYQAMKVKRGYWPLFASCSPSESKHLWKTLPTKFIPEVWDELKLSVMTHLVYIKFTSESKESLQIRKSLYETANKTLIEYNWWGDTFWGIDYKKGGKNNLGKVLMNVRKTLL